MLTDSQHIQADRHMAQTAIFGPFLALMALTFVVWVYMYIRRIRFISVNNINTRDLEKPGELARLSPAAISNPSDNLKNLFELPVLFYALALYLFAVAQVDAVYVLAAWAYVAFRALHSVVHCTFNLVMLRFSLYIASAVTLWLMAARAGWAYLAA